MILKYIFMLSLLSTASSFRVLIISSNFCFSHLQYDGKFADILVKAGHEVDFVIANHNPMEKANGSKLANIIRYESSRIEEVATKMKEMNEKYFNLDTFHNDMRMGGNLAEGFAPYCDSLLSDKPFLDYLRSRNYTVGMAQFFESCAFGVFEFLGIKSTHELKAIPIEDMTLYYNGLPMLTSYIRSMNNVQQFSPILTFFERAQNLYYGAINYLFDSGIAFHQIDAVYKKLISPDFPRFMELMSRVSYVWVNVHPLVYTQQPLSEKFKLIGGIAVQEPTPLNKETLDIFDKAKKGVVLLSFGAYVDKTSLKPKLKNTILEAFSQFPDYEFIWKFDGEFENISTEYPNVHLMKWINQVGILANPKTKAFISHLGLNSFNEATMHGIPLIGLPIYGDQPRNMAVGIERGIAYFLDRKTLDTSGLIKALNEVLFNEKYQQNAQILKEKIASYPVNFTDQFVKSVEFAEKFGNLKEFELQSVNLNFFQYYSLDIIFVAILLLSISLLLLKRLSVFLFNKFQYSQVLKSKTA